MREPELARLANGGSDRRRADTVPRTAAAFYIGGRSMPVFPVSGRTASKDRSKSILGTVIWVSWLAFWTAFKVAGRDLKVVPLVLFCGILRMCLSILSLKVKFQLFGFRWIPSAIRGCFTGTASGWGLSFELRACGSSGGKGSPNFCVTGFVSSQEFGSSRRGSYFAFLSTVCDDKWFWSFDNPLAAWYEQQCSASRNGYVWCGALIAQLFFFVLLTVANKIALFSSLFS